MIQIISYIEKNPALVSAGFFNFEVPGGFEPPSTVLQTGA